MTMRLKQRQFVLGLSLLWWKQGSRRCTCRNSTYDDKSNVGNFKVRVAAIAVTMKMAISDERSVTNLPISNGCPLFQNRRSTAGAANG